MTARRRRPAPPAAAPPFSFRRFGLNLALAVAPVVVAWVALTPVYDRFLVLAGERLVHVAESPDVTELLPVLEDRHYAAITRTDLPPARRRVTTFRVTDLHFNLILVAALFLAVPGEPWRRRLGNLGWAVFAAVLFHLLLVLFQVKFVYATQLGAWSLEHFGPFERNFWGLGKHLLDLPLKLAFPFALWAAFYLPRLGGTPPAAGKAAAPPGG